jgi:alpha-beta hydrolase superfamily lysophospholipase
LRGYGTGGGFPVGSFGTSQADLAVQFYQAVTTSLNANIYDAPVSLTGHSLGGGLAGLV